jgi:hypothetical protein
MTLDEEDIWAIGRGHFGCEKYKILASAMFSRRRDR